MARSARSRRLGWLRSIDAGTGATAVLGAHRAIDEELKAVLKNGKVPLTLATPVLDPVYESNIRKRLPRNAPARHVLIRSFRQVLEAGDPDDFLAWHEGGAAISQVLAIRNVHPHPRFPLTFGHHTVSYTRMIYTFYLPLLLGHTRPYDAVLCSSEAARQLLQKMLGHVQETFNRSYGAHAKFRARFEQIPLGIDTERFRPRAKRPIRRRLHLHPDSFTLLYLGRLSQDDKAVLLPLVLLFRRLLRRHPRQRLKLVFAGSDPSRYGNTISAYAVALGIGESVKVVTDVPLGTEHLWHAAADVFVSPSDNLQEAFGLTPIEAMACGVPQVVSDWNGYRDSVVHGVTGFLVPTAWPEDHRDLEAVQPWETAPRDHSALAQAVAFDPNAWLEAVEALLLNPDLRRRMGEASRRRALSHYAWPVVIKQREALWHELAAVAKRTPLPQARLNWGSVPYSKVFGHYPTTSFARGSPLMLTDDGRAVAENREPLPVFQSWSEVVDENLLHQMLERLAKDRELTLEGITRLFTTKSHFETDRIRRHVFTLIKHGLVAIDWMSGTGTR